MPSIQHWLIVLVLVLIVFGAGRLPDVLKQMGKGMREFKDASDGVKKGKREEPDDEDDEKAAFEDFKRKRRESKQLGQDAPSAVVPGTGEDADGDGDNDDAGSVAGSKTRSRSG